MTPKDNRGTEVIDLEGNEPQPNIANLVLGALDKQSKTMSDALHKTDQTLEQAKNMVTGVLDYVHKDFTQEVQKQLGSIRDELETSQWTLDQRIRDNETKTNDTLWEHSDSISSLLGF